MFFICKKISNIWNRQTQSGIQIAIFLQNTFLNTICQNFPRCLMKEISRNLQASAIHEENMADGTWPSGRVL